jgi:AcrR family transcriptional regulator
MSGDLYTGAMNTGTVVRSRVRDEMVAEIKRLARAQVVRDGAARLSLRAVSREMGMVSSAIYRYFPSRDHLLTALIIDGYEALGAAVEEAEALVARPDLPGRWRAAAGALRGWALAHPGEYGLLFGTPVPGYAAPSDTIGPAMRYSAVLVALLVDIDRAGLGPPPGPAPAPPLATELEVLRARLDADISDDLILVGVAAWMTLFGAISLELFGHLHNVIDAPEVHYAALVDALGRQLLGTGTPRPVER